MTRRSRAELALTAYYDAERARLTRDRYHAAFLNDLRDHHGCPPGHDGALLAWAAGHPAVGAGGPAAYREKFGHAQAGLPVPARAAVHAALADYVLSLVPEMMAAARPCWKTDNLVGAGREAVAGMSDGAYGRDWWTSHADPPDQIDLADRLEFLRACHRTNLRVVRERPAPVARVVLFHPVRLRRHTVAEQEWDARGRIVPKEWRGRAV